MPCVTHKMLQTCLRQGTGDGSCFCNNPQLRPLACALWDRQLVRSFQYALCFYTRKPATVIACRAGCARSCDSKCTEHQSNILHPTVCRHISNGFCTTKYLTCTPLMMMFVVWAVLKKEKCRFQLLHALNYCLTEIQRNKRVSPQARRPRFLGRNETTKYSC